MKDEFEYTPTTTETEANAPAFGFSSPAPMYDENGFEIEADSAADTNADLAFLLDAFLTEDYHTLSHFDYEEENPDQETASLDEPDADLDTIAQCAESDTVPAAEEDGKETPIEALTDGDDMIESAEAFALDQSNTMAASDDGAVNDDAGFVAASDDVTMADAETPAPRFTPDGFEIVHEEDPAQGGTEYTLHADDPTPLDELIPTEPTYIDGFELEKPAREETEEAPITLPTFDDEEEEDDGSRHEETTITLTKQVVLKAIDEVWVSTIEEALPILDRVMRRPTRYIKETDRVLPIEQSHNIKARSIRDLSRHSDYLKETKEGKLIPSKILNVFRDETLETYENRFVNTLVTRLFDFVHTRFRDAGELNRDEKKTVLTYTNSYKEGDKQGKITVILEESVPPTPADHAFGMTADKELWTKVVRLHDITRSYLGSEFCVNMGMDYIRPPVIRTNALLLNPDLRQCLALWDFIEGYDAIGYEALTQSFGANVSEEKLQSIIDNARAQYDAFLQVIKSVRNYTELGEPTRIKPRYRTEEVVEETTELDITQTVFRPVVDIVYSAKQTEGYTTLSRKGTQKILSSLEECLAHGLVDEKEWLLERKGEIMYTYGFVAKLSKGSAELRSAYSAVKDALLSHVGIKARPSFGYETFYLGRKKVAMLQVVGKSLVLNIAPMDDPYPAKFRTTTVTSKKYSAIPVKMRIRGSRSAYYGVQAVKMLMQSMGITRGAPTGVDYCPPVYTLRDLLDKGYAKQKLAIAYRGNFDNDTDDENE